MKFEKGKSGNPTGRPKGTRNNATYEVKELVISVLKKEYTAVKISQDIKKLDAGQRLNFFFKLARLILPREQDLKIDYNKLSEDDIDLIIDKISSNE